MAFVIGINPLCMAVTLLALAGGSAAGSLRELDNELGRIRESHGLAAVAAVVVNRDGIILEHYSGVEDWRTGVPISSSTWFRSGSVTKVFTGLALLRAEEHGLLRLDQPVAGHLTESDLEFAFTNPYSPSAQLLIADLSEHTAGWFDMSGEEFDDADSAPRTVEEALRFKPASRISQWPPGRFYAYSNSGAGLAALVVERAVDQDFDDWIRMRVFEPLGMSATLRWSEQIEKLRATGYDRDYRTPIPYWHIIFRSAGGMNLRPVEMERFLRMMLNRGELDGERIFSASQIDRLITPTRSLAARAGMRHGYGLGIYSSIRNGHVLYMHGGDADGYLSHFALSMESGLGYFVVVNAFNYEPLNDMKKALDAYLIEGLGEAQVPAAVVIPQEMLDKVAGTYTLASTRWPVPGWKEQSISLEPGQGGIWVRYPERTLQLKATRRDPHKVLLRRRGDPLATRALVLLADGSIVYQDSRSSWVRQPD